ncbi:hypothetical protein HPB47_008415, partial [Ixodes persulcatus]
MGHSDRNVAPSSAKPSLKGSTVEDVLNAKLFIDETVAGRLKRGHSIRWTQVPKAAAVVSLSK